MSRDEVGLVAFALGVFTLILVLGSLALTAAAQANPLAGVTDMPSGWVCIDLRQDCGGGK